MENINSWDDIQWQTVEKLTFRLQLRIFKASKNQEWEKMYKLQKLLISSKFAKYLSVRKITEVNAGRKTSGVDKIVITTEKQKFTLANQLDLNGKCSPILRKYIPKSDGTERPLGIPTMEDRAKQMLAYLAFNPQWEAQFEECSYGFRPGRSVLDAMESVFLGISKKPKWVLDADIAKCFDKINHEHLLNKCNTYDEMRKQIQSWLKAGILEGDHYAFPEMGTPQGGIILPLLVNIALHGLRNELDEYIMATQGRWKPYRQTLTFVRYADDFILMHPEKSVLKELIEVTQNFLKPIGLELHSTKTRIIHTFESSETSSPGFTFLGFDVVHKSSRNKQRRATKKQKSKQPFILIITPSKAGVKLHKRKIRDTIRRYRGISQENLILQLNPIIRGWALSKRTQIASKTFQELDSYIYTCLWKWARKRHPKMSKLNLKDKYWHKENNNNWIFGIKKDNEVNLKIQKYSKIKIQRHVKVKGAASPFDGNLIYWAQRTGKSTLIPSMKSRLIKEQNGRCGICNDLFLPDDILERDHIILKALGGKNLRNNVQAVHYYCHRRKTRKDLKDIHRNKIKN